MKNLLWLVVLILLAAVAYGALTTLPNMLKPQEGERSAVTSFEECEDAGYPIIEEDGETTCHAPQEDGIFTKQNNEEASKDDLIVVVSPKPNEPVSTPLLITGRARGNWYFEATFPVELRDATGKKIAEHFAQAQGDWMTSEYVPFAARLTFAKPATPTGTLILHKSNASGLPEHDNKLEIPVRFE